MIKHVLLERTEVIKAFELPCRTQSCNLVIFESWHFAIIQYSNHSPFGDLQFRTEQADDLVPQRETRLRQSGALLGVWSLTRAGVSKESAVARNANLLVQEMAKKTKTQDIDCKETSHG